MQNKFIPYGKQDINNQDIESVLEVLNSDFVSNMWEKKKSQFHWQNLIRKKNYDFHIFKEKENNLTIIDKKK